MNKKVSVIMAAFNSERYISEAIQSVLDQSYSNFELIIVNDGSTDNTLEVIKGFKDSRIVVHSQMNKGQCAATNVAYKLSKGELILFLDSDDKIDAHKISRQVSSITSFQDISTSPFSVFPGSDGPEWNSLCYTMSGYEFIKRSLYTGDHLANSSFLIPRHLIDKAGVYDESLTVNNDFEFFNRVISHSKRVIFCPQALTFYRRDVQDSLSQRKDHGSLSNHLSARIKSYEYLLQKFNNEEIRCLVDYDLRRMIYSVFFKDRAVASKAFGFLRRFGCSIKIEHKNQSRFGLVQRLVGFKLAVKLKRNLNYLGLLS